MTEPTMSEQNITWALDWAKDPPQGYGCIADVLLALAAERDALRAERDTTELEAVVLRAQGIAFADSAQTWEERADRAEADVKRLIAERDAERSRVAYGEVRADRAEAERDALRAEREEALGAIFTHSGIADLAIARADRAEAARDLWHKQHEEVLKTTLPEVTMRANRAEAALRKYGQHENGCPMIVTPQLCNCGLAAAIAEVAP